MAVRSAIVRTSKYHRARGTEATSGRQTSDSEGSRHPFPRSGEPFFTFFARKLRYYRKMIRFSCTSCQREYLLADAMAHLPLLCKGCGHRLEVPNPTPEAIEVREEPKPAFERSIAGAMKSTPVHLTSDEKYNVREEHVSTAADSEVDLFLSLEVRKKLSVPIEGSEAVRVSAPHPAIQKPPPTPSAVEAKQPRKILAFVVDVAIALLVLVVGAIVGETLAGKPMGEILRSAGSAPKFPPTDLLVWLGSSVVFGLIYAWLGTRGWTVGCWLKRR